MQRLSTHRYSALTQAYSDDIKSEYAAWNERMNKRGFLSRGWLYYSVNEQQLLDNMF